jgi:putative membrane protein
MRPGQLLDPAARLRLEATVIESERNTEGEIVVVVARACDEYGSAGWRLGVSLAALVFAGLLAFVPPLAGWIYLAAQAAAIAVAHAMARIDAVRRLLLARPLVQTRVAERAIHAFAANGLTRTQNRTGILIFVALLERRVVVLADEGIHRALDPNENWQQVVDLAVDGLRRGDAVDGLEAAIRRCGEILARHVPVQGRNPNELPNRIVLED